MAEKNFLKIYPDLVARLRAGIPGDAAFEAAVGGNFIAVGRLELALLQSLGLSSGQFVIDVGCGSGRLALQLSSMAELRYLGTDVVPDLLSHAEKLCRRADWTFATTNGTAIPCADESADFVCFFSVFTHLTHEDTFRYLREAKRVLKPGGHVVFSFLEFYIPSHWCIFEQAVDHSHPGDHLNQFVDRPGIEIWADKLGFKTDLIADGDKPHIPIAEDIVWSDGRVMREKGALGQSVAVLSTPKKIPDTAVSAASNSNFPATFSLPVRGHHVCI